MCRFSSTRASRGAPRDAASESRAPLRATRSAGTIGSPSPAARRSAPVAYALDASSSAKSFPSLTLLEARLACRRILRREALPRPQDDEITAQRGGEADPRQDAATEAITGTAHCCTAWVKRFGATVGVLTLPMRPAHRAARRAHPADPRWRGSSSTNAASSASLQGSDGASLQTPSSIDLPRNAYGDDGTRPWRTEIVQRRERHLGGIEPAPDCAATAAAGSSRRRAVAGASNEALAQSDRGCAAQRLCADTSAFGARGAFSSSTQYRACCEGIDRQRHAGVAQSSRVEALGIKLRARKGRRQTNALSGRFDRGLRRPRLCYASISRPRSLDAATWIAARKPSRQTAHEVVGVARNEGQTMRQM